MARSNPKSSRTAQPASNKTKQPNTATQPSMQQQTTPAPDITPAAPAVETTVDVSNVPVSAKPLTDRSAAALRQAQDASYDGSTMAAVKMYTSKADFSGGYSLSQTMNYLLDNGVDFSTDDVQTINRRYGLRLTDREWASMQYTHTYTQRAMHPLGQDTELQRGAHDDLLRTTFGIQDYSKLTEKQLQAKLVGQAFQNTSPMSTSYDITRNPFLGSGSGVSGGREVIYRIKAGKNTRCIFGAKAQSEIVLSEGTKFRITNVQYTGKMATPRTRAKAVKQIVIDIETF